MEEIKIKDSGIKWIGNIPGNWNIKRLKYCVRKKITDGPHETPVFVDDGVIFLSVDSIQDGKIVFENTRFISCEDAKRYDKKCKLEKNDVLIGKAASTGKIAIVDKDVYFQVWSPLAIVKTHNKILDSNFLRYYLLSPAGQENIDNFCTMNTQKNIAMEDIERLSIVIPTLQEQLKVAGFLDKKCADIDEIISKTEKQIQTLEQYKKSLVTETITKGLNSSIEMKYSGYEWIGDIPKHWEAKKLKYILKEIKVGPFGSALSNTDFKAEGYWVYNQRTVLDENYQTNDTFIDEQKYKEMIGFKVKSGDLLITTRGTIGKVSIVPNEFYQGIIHPCIIRFQCDETKILPELVKIIFNWSTLLSDQLNKFSNATTIEVIYSYTLKDVIIPIIPLDEQRKILEFLKLKLNKTDELINKQKESLETLKKYKQSLIYEYVTGKKRV